MSEAARARALSDVLMVLGTETDVLPEDIREAVSEHPEFQAEIVAFALEWHTAPDAPRSAADEAVSVAVPLDPRETVETPDPFSGRTAAELRELAAVCEIPVSILSKFSSSLIEAATVPLLLVRRMAEFRSVSPATILTHLDRRQSLAANADFRSFKPPEVAGKLSFADAVQGATMPDEQRARWLELAR